MPRYSLRTLIVVMLLGGPVLALAWNWRDVTVSLVVLLFWLAAFAGVCVLMTWISVRLLDALLGD